MTGVETQGVFRADQIGSLLRPSRLLGARDEFRTGKIGTPGLTKLRNAPKARSSCSRLVQTPMSCPRQRPWMK